KVKTQKIPIHKLELLRLRVLKARCALIQGTAEGDKQARAALLALEKEIAAARDKSAQWIYLSVECQGVGGLAEVDRRNGAVISAINRFRRCLTDLETLREARSWQAQFVCRLDLSYQYRNLTRFSDAKDHLDAAEKLLPRIRNERNRA